MAKTRSLVVLLEEHPTGSDDAIVHARGVVTTRAELDSLVEQIHELIATHGLGGAITGVSMPNGQAAIATWFAIWRTFRPEMS